MGTVTGFTADRLLEIEAQGLVAGFVIDGVLYLERQNGDVVTAGPVTTDWEKVDPIKLEPVVVPQMRSINVVQYSHSLGVPAGWHTATNHWSTRLAAKSLPYQYANFGVAGSTMETNAKLITGGTASRWNPGSTKWLAIIMSVMNSAVGVIPGSNLALSIESMIDAARVMIVAIISDGYSSLDVVPGHTFNATGASGFLGLSVSGGRPSPTYPSGGFVYASADAAWTQFTVPVGVSNRHVWVEFLTNNIGVAQPTVRVTKNGTIVTDKLIPVLDKDTVDYSKCMIHVGVCSAGDVIRMTKMGATGVLSYNGCYISGDRSHAAMVCDIEGIDSATYPFFNVPTIVEAHNDALKDLVDEMNALVPNAASIIDLSKDPTYPGVPSQWTGDTLHPNDLGQSWYAARMSQKLAKALPWTPRLHTL